MPKMANRVQETTTTGGTGTLTLAGAVTGYLTFAASFSVNDVLFYTIDNGVGEWEIGLGTLTSSSTLSRSTVLASSNAGGLVNFSSGTKRVFCSAPTRALVPDQDSKSGFVLSTDGTTPTWTQTLNSITLGNVTPGSGAFTTLSASSTVSGTGFSTYLASPPAIGGTTAAAGSFTTLSASSTVSGTGFSTYLASPPAIGGTTAAAGSFTTLSASSTVSGTGFSTYLASPPAIGGTTAAAGSFTTLSASSTVSGTGFSTYLASPPAIGGTTPAAGTFTTLASTGNTTIGDATGDTLTINATAVSCPNNLNFDSNTFVIDATNNRLGSGTASPSTDIHVVKSTLSTSIALRLGTTDPRKVFDIDYDPTNALGKVGFVSGDTYSSADLTLWTNALERVRVTSAGFVGIGVDPARMFHVQGANGIWRLDRDANTVALQLHRFPSGDFTTPWKGFQVGVLASGSDNGYFSIADYGTAVSGASTERLQIDNAGTLILRQTSNAANTSVSLNTTVQTALTLDSSGNLGLGTSSFGTSAASALAIKTGTAPSAGVADTIHIFSTDLSAGNTILSLRTEGTGVVSSNTGTTNLSNRIAIRVNGTVYYLLAASAA